MLCILFTFCKVFNYFGDPLKADTGARACKQKLVYYHVSYYMVDSRKGPRSPVEGHLLNDLHGPGPHITFLSRPQAKQGTRFHTPHCQVYMSPLLQLGTNHCPWHPCTSIFPLIADQFSNLSSELVTLMVLPHCQMLGLVV